MLDKAFPQYRSRNLGIWWKCCPLQDGSRYHKFMCLEQIAIEHFTCSLCVSLSEGEAKECADGDVQSQPNHWSTTTTAGRSAVCVHRTALSKGKRTEWPIANGPCVNHDVSRLLVALLWYRTIWQHR